MLAFHRCGGEKVSQMWRITQYTLIFAVLSIVVGCGKEHEMATDNWDTPTRLAIYMAEKLDDDYNKAPALIVIASSLAEAGNTEQAVAALNQALDVDEKREFPILDTSTRRDIISALATTEQTSLDLASLKDVLGLAQQSVDHECGHVFTVTTPTRAGVLLDDVSPFQKQLLEEARRHEIESDSDFKFFNDSYLSDNAKDFANAGNIQQAVETTQRIEDLGLRANSFVRIASVLVQLGDHTQSLATLRHSVSVAQEIEDLDHRKYVLSDIALMLVTEPVSENESNYPIRRMKKSFTPEEKQLAKQLVEAIQVN